MSNGCSKPALFYGLPKIHKPDVPLRPIVSHTGHPLYNTAKCLAQLLSPFSKIVRLHVENSSRLAEIVRNTTIEPDEVLVSLDVKSLFTSVPAKEAVNLQVRQKNSLGRRIMGTPVANPDLHHCLALIICLEDTTFKFHEEFYQMTDGLAMGSPISPVVANIFMEDLERNAIATMTDGPRLWLCFVDDTLTILKRYTLQASLDHLTQQNPAIQFTMEVEKDGKLPFLDAELEQQGTHLSMTVYRKPTHSGRYLNFESHHPVTAKCRTVDALFSRPEAIITNEEQKQAEFSKIKQELLANDYPARFIDNPLTRIKQRKTGESVRSRDAEAEDQRRQRTVLVPFIDGVTQPLQRILRPLNVRVVGKPRNWKWSLKQKVKDQTSRENDPGVVYRLKCGDCEQAYIGETGRTACVRIKEHASYVKSGRFHMSAAAAIFEQHALDFDNVEVIICEPHGLKRRVKEALHINAEKHSMNKDNGLELNTIWFSLFP